MKRIVGVLDPFWETGSEGIHWAVTDNELMGYDALNILEDGDYLFIEDGFGNIDWEGCIDLRKDTNLEPFPYNDRGDKWQRVNECTVHGLQDGVDPKRWFDWFAEERPAVLIKHGYANETD